MFRGIGKWLFLRRVRRFLAEVSPSVQGLTEAAAARATSAYQRTRDHIAPRLARRLRHHLADAKSRLRLVEPITEFTSAYPPAAWLWTGLMMLLADMQFGYYAIRSSASSVTWPIALVVAILIAVFLAAGCHGLTTVSLRRPLQNKRLRDSVRVEQVVAQHRRVFRVFFWISVAAVLALMISRFLPAEWVGPLVTSWGWMPFVVLSITLPAAAGIATALGHFLSAPEDAKEEVRAIEEFLIQLGEEQPAGDSDSTSAPAGATSATHKALMLAFLLAVAPGIARADGACLIPMDETASVFAPDRELASAFLVDTVLEITQRYECSEVVVARFSDEGPWTRRRTFVVPQEPTTVDCTQLEPEPLTGTLAFYEILDKVREHRRSELVAACEPEQAAIQQEFHRQQTVFVDAVRHALEVAEPQRRVTTRILGLLRGVLQETRRYNVIIVVSDGVESLSREPIPLEFPHGIDIVMLLARPGPEYTRNAAPADYVSLWEQRVPGMRVVRVTELYHDLWHDLAASREIQ